MNSANIAVNNQQFQLLLPFRRLAEGLKPPNTGVFAHQKQTTSNRELILKRKKRVATKRRDTRSTTRLVTQSVNISLGHVTDYSPNKTDLLQAKVGEFMGN